jgi:hypothetical protein
MGTTEKQNIYERKRGIRQTVEVESEVLTAAV